MTGITGEQFISAIAGQRDGHMASRHLGNVISRNGGRIGEWFIEKTRQFGDKIRDIRLHHILVVIAPHLLGHLLRIHQFIVCRIVEADRAGDNRPVESFRHVCDDRRRIDTAAQERS